MALSLTGEITAEHRANAARGSIMDVKFFSSTAGLPASFKTLSGYTMATRENVWDANQHDSPAIASQRLGRTHGVYGQKRKHKKKRKGKQAATVASKEAEKRAVEDAAPPATEAPADDAAAAPEAAELADSATAPPTPQRSADSLALAVAGSYSARKTQESARVRQQLQNDLRGTDEGLGLLDSSEVKDWLKDLGLVQYWPSFCTSGYKTFEDVVRLDGTLVHTQLAVFRPAHAVKLERAVMALRKERGIPEPQYKMPQPPSGGISPRTRRARARETHRGYVNPGASPRTSSRRVVAQPSGSRSSLAMVPRANPPGTTLADAKIRKTIGGTQVVGGYAMPPAPTRDPYTGETRNGKPHGHGVMTGPDGRAYEGEWRDGRRCGKGEETLRSGERYVGDWDSDEKSGFGIWEGADGSRYEGSYVNGQWQGKGTYEAADGTRFEGMWLNGLLHGTGTCIDASGSYSGEWMHGERHGRGHLTRENGEEYLGEWRHDEQTGAVEKAVIFAPGGGGGVYSGTFRQGLPNGKGKLEQEDGGCYEGEWKDGRRDGWGVQESPNGDTYKGMYHDGLQAGKGVWICTDGSKYEGDWRMGHRHGDGTWTAASGSTYSGRWQNGAMTGRGTLSLPNGHQQSGEFREGVIWRGAWMDDKGSLLGGWRAGQYYPGRDTSGRLLQALPELMARPAALLLEDAGGGSQQGAEPEAEAEEAKQQHATPHEALCFPALVS